MNFNDYLRENLKDDKELRQFITSFVLDFNVHNNPKQLVDELMHIIKILRG